jgi:hypothetical protein
MPQLLPHSGKKAPFYQSKTVSFHFLSLPMLLRRRSGVVNLRILPNCRHLATAFAVAGEKQEMVADQEARGIAKTLLAQSRRREDKGGIRACSKSRAEIP